MRAVGAGHAESEEPTEACLGDHVRLIFEEAWVKPGFPDERMRIDAKVAQGR